MPTSEIQSSASKRGSSAGFTLIEMMIVVVIIAVLATVAGIAYSSHFKETRILDARQMLNHIKVQQEVYFQNHQSYVSAQYHPAVHSDYAARPWAPLPSDWANLNISSSSSGNTYFSFMTVGLAPAATDAIATQLGLNSKIATFYAVAQGDMDGNPATQPMKMVIGSQSAKILVTNDGH